MASAQVGPLGGTLCLPDNRVCVDVPNGALTETAVILLGPTAEVPGAVIGEGVEISVAGKERYRLQKPVTVRFDLDVILKSPLTRSLPNDSVLRVYTKGETGDWEPLANPAVDRVRRTIVGVTEHFSPFVILRSDRLSDGGLPIELDASVPDASVIVVPPFDGGVPDAGRPDAGRPDAGRPDAGAPDAGTPDAGSFDAGLPDAGVPDAGTPDAGPVDAGRPDAGRPDAGPPDAGPADAGAPDAGSADAGPPDAGLPDAGPVDAGVPDAGQPMSDGGSDSGM
jgi:hypothetical protein